MKQQAILDMFSRLDEFDHYEVLGVDRNADKKALKNAYYKLANEFHPDRHFRKRLGDFKPKLEAIFKRITLAHDVLTSDARLAYDLELTLGQVTSARTPRAPSTATSPSPPAATATAVRATPPAEAPRTPTGPVAPIPPTRGSAPAAPVPPPIRQSAPSVPDGTSVGTIGTSPAQARQSGPIAPGHIQPAPTAVRQTGNFSPAPPTTSTTPSASGATSGGGLGPVHPSAARTPTGPIQPPPARVSPQSPIIPAAPPPRPASASTPLHGIAPIATPAPPGAAARVPATTPTPSPARALTEEEIRARKRALASKLGVRTAPTAPLPDAESDEGKFQRAINMINDAMSRGDRASAVRALKVATLLRPDDVGLRQQLEVLGQEQARQEMSELWDSGSKLSQQGAWPEALRDLSRAISIMGKAAPGQLLNSAAIAALKVGGPNELHVASSYARQAVDLDPYSQEFRLTLVEVYLGAGLALNAKRELEAAAKIDPTSIRLRTIQERLGIK